MPHFISSLLLSTAYKDWLFRVSNILKFILFSALSLLISGCASLSGDWPNLAEPYPDASARDRVIERANPVQPTRVQDESPLTRSSAYKLMESTRAQLSTARESYLAIKAKLKNASGDDQTDLWNEAQLSLTRLSHTASRLDGILNSEKLKDAPVWVSASALKNTQDTFLVVERKALAVLKP